LTRFFSAPLTGGLAVALVVLSSAGWGALPVASAAGSGGPTLSAVSVLGYFPYKNPKPASWYLSNFQGDFKAFFYEDVPLGDLTEVREVDSLASQYPRVDFYVGFLIPATIDLYNATQYSDVETELREDLEAINATNVVGVEISAMAYGLWDVAWVKSPPEAELEAWYSWLSERDLPRVPFAQNGTVYTPLFAEWALDSSAQLAAGLINYSRNVKPGLMYGLAQFDSVAVDEDTVQSLYTFVTAAHPNFTVTQDLALARPVEGYTSYPYAYVLLTVPMAPQYRDSVGVLWVDDSFAAITSSSRDTTGMAMFKFSLNELSTYLFNATPLVNAFFVGPDGNYVPLQEYVLDPALQIGLSSIPRPSSAPAQVLVIRPTYSIGNVNVSGSIQQQLFYSLIRMGVRFDYVSEAYVYAHPGVLRNYKYIIYASDEITPQMNYILWQDNSSQKIGLSSTFVGYFYSRLPARYSLPFNLYLASYNTSSLSFLGRELPPANHELFFGLNVLSWNSTGLYLNGNLVSVKATDYLGLTSGWVSFLYVAVILAILGFGVASYSMIRGWRKRQRIRKILEKGSTTESMG